MREWGSREKRKCVSLYNNWENRLEQKKSFSMCSL